MLLLFIKTMLLLHLTEKIVIQT